MNETSNKMLHNISICCCFYHIRPSSGLTRGDSRVFCHNLVNKRLFDVIGRIKTLRGKHQNIKRKFLQYLHITISGSICVSNDHQGWMWRIWKISGVIAWWDYHSCDVFQTNMHHNKFSSLCWSCNAWKFSYAFQIHKS